MENWEKYKEEVIKLIAKEYPINEKYSLVDWKSGYKVKEIDLSKESNILLGSFNAG